MKAPNQQLEQRRIRLLEQIEPLAEQAIFGTLSQTYRTCGTPGCRCHHGGPKHGPHLYISYSGPSGKTTGYYVPKAVQPQVRKGVQAWSRLQKNLRQLALLNKQRIVASGKKRTFATGSN
jgi:uncharacterized protein DUF6788